MIVMRGGQSDKLVFSVLPPLETCGFILPKSVKT